MTKQILLIDTTTQNEISKLFYDTFGYSSGWYLMKIEKSYDRFYGEVLTVTKENSRVRVFVDTVDNVCTSSVLISGVGEGQSLVGTTAQVQVFCKKVVAILENKFKIVPRVTPTWDGDRLSDAFNKRMSKLYDKIIEAVAEFDWNNLTLNSDVEITVCSNSVNFYVGNDSKRVGGLSIEVAENIRTEYICYILKELVEQNV